MYRVAASQPGADAVRLGLVTISTQRLCGLESRSTFGPVTTASFSRDLALELHRAFTELDRSRSSRTVANAVTVKLIAVRSKLAEWQASRVEESALDPKWQAVKTELDAFSTHAENADRTSLVELRTRVQPTYEQIVSMLAKERVEVPSLRPTNYARNVLHVASALSGVLALELLPSWTWATGVALTIAALGWTLEITRTRSPAINQFCMKLFGKTAHPHEAHRVNSATWYASALVLMSLTHALVPCLIALWVLGFGDPAAAIIGRRFGKRQLVHGRTLEGTLAFVVFGAASAFTFLMFTHPESGPLALGIMSVCGAITGALAELWSRRVDDNLSIPLAACVGAGLAQLLIG